MCVGREDFLILGRYNAPNGMSVSLLLGVLLCNDSSLFLSLSVVVDDVTNGSLIVTPHLPTTLYIYYVLCAYMERTRVH